MSNAGVRFEREIVQSASVPGVLLVKVPVGYSRSLRFVGGGAVDFVGVVDGIPVAIEAKSCRTDRFDLGRISDKQIEFLKRWSDCGGFSAVMLRFGYRDARLFLICLPMLLKWLDYGMKSVTLKQLSSLPSIPRRDGRWRLECLTTLVRRCYDERE